MVKIKLYEIYCFDIENALGQKNNDFNVATVQVLDRRFKPNNAWKILSKLRWPDRLIKDRNYEFKVVSMDTGKVFWTKPELLTPLPDTKVNVCLRFPNNTPQVSLESLNCLRKVIDIIKPKDNELGKKLYLLHNQLAFYISIGAFYDDTEKLNDMLNKMAENSDFDGLNYNSFKEGKEDV